MPVTTTRHRRISASPSLTTGDAAASIRRQMTAYYFLAVGFGVLATIISVVGIWGPGKHENFPGKLSVPLMLLFFVIAVATLAALSVGAANEHEAEHEAESEQAALYAPGA